MMKERKTEVGFCRRLHTPGASGKSVPKDFQEKYSIYPRLILCLSAISDAIDILDRLHVMIYI
jgi:hypothetical protein